MDPKEYVPPQGAFFFNGSALTSYSFGHAHKSAFPTQTDLLMPVKLNKNKILLGAVSWKWSATCGNMNVNF